MTDCPVHKTHEWLVAFSERVEDSVLVYVICRWCREMRPETFDD